MVEPRRSASTAHEGRRDKPEERSPHLGFSLDSLGLDRSMDSPRIPASGRAFTPQCILRSRSKEIYGLSDRSLMAYGVFSKTWGFHSCLNGTQASSAVLVHSILYGDSRSKTLRQPLRDDGDMSQQSSFEVVSTEDPGTRRMAVRRPEDSRFEI